MQCPSKKLQLLIFTCFAIRCFIYIFPGLGKGGRAFWGMCACVCVSVCHRSVCILFCIYVNTSKINKLEKKSMSIPYFVQIWLMGTKCSAEMWFVESNSEYFGPLTSGGHLGFWDKWKILAQACFKGQVVCPCQTLYKSDERDPNVELKCDFWSQIW